MIDALSASAGCDPNPVAVSASRRPSGSLELRFAIEFMVDGASRKGDLGDQG